MATGVRLSMGLASVAALAAALSTAGCTAPPLAGWSYRPPPPGYAWSLDQKNTGSFGKDARVRLTRGDGTWQGRPAHTFRNQTGMTTYADPATGRWFGFVSPEGKTTLSWEPPIGWEFPLWVGKRWTTPYRMTLHAANRTITYDFTCDVAGYGDVTVPAGTFKAYRIECASTIDTVEVYWSAPELGFFVKTSLKRGPKNPFGPGTQEAELVSLDPRP